MHRFSIEIARAGFLLSPVVMNKEQFATLLAERSRAADSPLDRAAVLFLETEQSTQAAWEREFSLTLEQIVISSRPDP